MSKTDVMIYDDLEISCIILQKIIKKFFPELKCQYVTTQDHLFDISVQPKVFFIDVMINSKLDGINVVEKLSKTHPNAHKIFYTGMEGDYLAPEMNRLNIKYILKKPIVIGDLIEIITELKL